MAAGIRVGVIGGTGLGEALGALGGELISGGGDAVRTSGAHRLTEADGVPVALLSRHGDGHRFNPTQVPYRANVFALKALGVTHVIASGAVGSLARRSSRATWWCRTRSSTAPIGAPAPSSRSCACTWSSPSPSAPP